MASCFTAVGETLRRPEKREWCFAFEGLSIDKNPAVTFGEGVAESDGRG